MGIRRIQLFLGMKAICAGRKFDYKYAVKFMYTVDFFFPFICIIYYFFTNEISVIITVDKTRRHNKWLVAFPLNWLEKLNILTVLEVR